MTLRLTLRFLATAAVAYLLIALLQTLCLEVWLDGQVHHGAPAGILAGGIAGTAASGLIGGWCAAFVGGQRPLLFASGVVIPLGLDTIYVLTKAAGDDPLWFSLGGSLTLMVATMTGGLVRARQRQGGDQPSSLAA